MSYLIPNVCVYTVIFFLDEYHQMLYKILGFPGCSVVKNPSLNARDTGWIPGGEDP